LRRRSNAGRNLAEAVDDLSTLTEYDSTDWNMHYDGKDIPFSSEVFDRTVPLSPTDYRKQKESGLNEMRSAAGLDTVAIHKREKDIRQLQAAAGI
jgi:hypothetical protein